MMGNLQANVSATGKRKNVSPQRKMTFVLAEFAALLIIHFVVEVISFIYMSCIGVDLATEYGRSCLLCLWAALSVWQ